MTFDSPPVAVLRQRARAAVVLAAKGSGLVSLEELLSVMRSSHPSTRENIERVWEEDVARWDPVDDEVAIDRALKGDLPVIANLTWFERERCIMAIAAETLAMDLRHMRQEDKVLAVQLADQRLAPFGIDYAHARDRL